MPLARRIKTKKKRYRLLLFCAFHSDHYDNKLQRYLTLARACFYKGKISRKSSSLLSVICSMRSLAHGFVQKKKMKLHETVAMKVVVSEHFGSF